MLACVWLGSPAAARATAPYLVRDINPGYFGSGEGYGYSPFDLIASGDTLFFTGCDGPQLPGDFSTITSHCEIWRSDGTPGGTARVTGINTASGTRLPVELVPLGNLVVFSECERPLGGLCE